MANKGGRPRIELDKDMFERFCHDHCSKKTIAYYFGCSVETIGRFCKKTYGCTFEEVYEQYKAHGSVMLRHKLMESAEKGNTAALIFALKNYEGMSDRPAEPKEATAAEFLSAIHELQKAEVKKIDEME